MCAADESPRPIPHTARPFDSICNVANALAVTATSRVIGLVTPVPNLIVLVAAAASESCPYGSADKFCVSGVNK